MKKLLRKLNIIHHTCDMLVGKDHKFLYRAIIGIVIMAVGVLIVKTIGYGDEPYTALAGYVIGHGLHGIGLIPFVEAIVENY